MKMKSKPLVKYRTTEIMGTTLRYKETLLTTITGPLAKIFIEADSRDEDLIWSFDFDNQKIDTYRSELLEGSVQEEDKEAEPNP
jgi:hypothetical protein